MQTSYLKEVWGEFRGINTLTVLNQKQFSDSINNTISKVIETNNVIFISMTKSAEDVFAMTQEKEKLFVIDVFSRESSFANGIESNIIYISNPANLTRIQIAVDKALKKFPDAIILFDSLGVLSIYSDERLFQKFIYLFSNKMNLIGGSILFFAVKGTMDEEILSTLKQFCDKTYDYSELYVESVELAN
jgi:hypothetical protein